MRKKAIVVLALLLFVVGCNTNNNVNEKSKSENVEKNDSEIIDIDSLVYPLYKITNDGYNYYYVNENVSVTFSNILIDNERKEVIDLENKKLLNYNDYISKNPVNVVINFVLLRSECREKVSCTEIGGCQIGNYGIQDLQEMIDPVNGVTPNYLMYEWCPVEISDEFIKQINDLEGFKVWGRGLENINDEKSPLSIAIELPSGDTYLNEKKLFDEYGLLNLFNASPKKYFNVRLNLSTCNKYNLKCEYKDL